jgi:hypothetical protein
MERASLPAAVRKAKQNGQKFIQYRWLPHQARTEAPEETLFGKYFLPDDTGSFAAAFGQNLPQIADLESKCDGHSIEVGAGAKLVGIHDVTEG